MTEPKSDSPRSRRYRRRVINLVLVIGVFAALQWWQSRTLVSGTAPALPSPLAREHPLDRPSPAAGPVLVHFWAEWCPVCRAEHGSIQSVAQDYRVITVAMQSGDAVAVRRYLADQGLKFAAVADPDGQIAARWGVSAVPTSFVVDDKDRIRFAAVGYTTEFGLRARLWAAGHL